MSEGPTTVGSINAYLELNIDRFLAKAAEAQAVADGLERKPVKATVTADTAPARRSLDDLERSMGRVESATKRVTAETKKAATAQEQFAKAGSQLMPALIGGLVAISSAAPPVAAAAVGLTGAFGVMAGVGVLGLSGIARGLKENNAVGQQYRSTVDSLAGSFHALQDSAASGLFPGVQKSATLLKSDMPVLNGLVQHFAGLLGADLPVGLDAVVTLITRATPLFDASAGYINRMVTGLDTWAHGSGYQQFLDYSLNALPQVMKFLGDVVHFAGDFLTAWAPVGSQTLPLVDGLITGLDTLVTHTGSLVPAIATAVGAFMMLRPVISVIQGVTTALKGMAVAEEAVAVAGSGVGKVGKLGTVGKAVGFGAPMALDGTTIGGGIGTAGGIGAGVGFGGLAAAGIGSLVLANALAPRTATQAQYTSGSVATDLAYFNSPELRRGRGGQNAQGSASALHTFAQNGGQGGFVNGFAGFLGGQTGTMVNNLDGAMASMVKSGNAQKAAAIVKQLGVSAKDAATDFPGYTAALAAASAKQAQVAGTVSAATTAWNAQNAALQAAAGAFQSQDSASNSAKDAMTAATAAIKANGTSLNENTVKGRANAEAVSAAVVAIQAHGAAMVKAGHSTAEAAVANDTMAISLERSLESMGVSKAAAESYVNKLMGIPKNRTTEAQLKIDKAKAQADAFDRDMKGKNYTAILKGDFSRAQKAAAQAAVYADKYARGDYKGIMKGDFTPAQKAAAQAKEFSILFARGDYKGILKGDFTPAEKAAATAKEKALAFARAKYLADLKANPQPANVSTADAARKAHGFAAGRYQAVLTANNGPALGTAAATVAQINAMRASISVSVTAVGGNGAQVARNALLGKTGGTAGSGAFGTMNAIKGMAYGGTGGGTISGPGTAASDTAGLYRLANGEEVVSNLFGQADRWRPLLKAINAGRVDGRTFEAVGQRMGWGRQQPTKSVTIAPSIHVHNPVAVDPVQQATEATQYALAYAGLG